jgi:hypothetical protein
VTLVPLAKEALQVLPQSMPAGALIAVPEPVPDLVTVRPKKETGVLKVAVTKCDVAMFTVQEPVPVQSPPHPLKVEPALGVAVSVTKVPLVNEARQVAGQLMPAGVLLTVPVPLPFTATDSSKPNFPIRLSPCSVNHKFPSGPLTM